MKVEIDSKMMFYIDGSRPPAPTPVYSAFGLVVDDLVAARPAGPWPLTLILTLIIIIIIINN